MCVGSTWFKVQGAEQQQSCLETFKAETRSTCWTLPGAQTSSRPTACIIHQYTLDAPFRTSHLSRLPAHNYNYVTTVASLVQDTNGFFRLGSGFFYARKRFMYLTYEKKGLPQVAPGPLRRNGTLFEILVTEHALHRQRLTLQKHIAGASDTGPAGQPPRLIKKKNTSCEAPSSNVQRTHVPRKELTKGPFDGPPTERRHIADTT